MKAADGCKLFGAHQALGGITDGVVLLHSVVGCNFGTFSLHALCNMADVRQTCTVVSDSDVVFGGEASLERALKHVAELYAPQAIFVVAGCVSAMIQDDIKSVAAAFQGDIPVIAIEAAGFNGSFSDGYEEGLAALINMVEPAEPFSMPTVNLIGFGADDPHADADIMAIRSLAGEKVRINAVLSRCTVETLKTASRAGLNIVLGRGEQLALKLQERFNIPYEVIDYPYGLTGADAFWRALEKRFSVDYSSEREAFKRHTAERLKPIYMFLQELYGIPAALVGSGGKSRGMARFLSEELGMDVALCATRETLGSIEAFYDDVRDSDAALLLGSSFENELAEELKLPLVRYDYPVFDRVCVTNRPFVGAEGTVCLVEELINEIMVVRTMKGALYR